MHRELEYAIIRPGNLVKGSS